MEIRPKPIRSKNRVRNATSFLFLKLLCACFLSVIFNLHSYLRVKTCRACRVKRMTCRLKSDRGNDPASLSRSVSPGKEGGKTSPIEESGQKKPKGFL